MDRRTAQGKTALNVWVTPELKKKLDKVRGMAPMQRYVVHVLEKEMEREYKEEP